MDRTLPKMNTSQPLPPITPQPDLLSHIYFLKREWEHAMQVNTIKGRDTEHIQQLMHAQFQFMEHIILDMSKQMRYLQDQLLVHQKSNQKLQDQMGVLEKQFAETQKESLESKKAIEYLQKVVDSGIRDLEGKCTHNHSKWEQNDQQMQSLLLGLTGYENRLLSVTERQSAFQEQVKEVQTSVQQFTKEMDTIKDLLSVEQRNTIQEKLNVHQQILQWQQQQVERLGMLESQLQQNCNHSLSAIEHCKEIFEKARKERYQEQETVISVLSTVKSSISNLRQEQKQFESKTLASLQSTLALFKDQVTREMRMATKPIIVH
jgi:chromosome segregation ATPase